MPSIASLVSTRAKAPPQADSGSFPVRLLCRVSCFQLVSFILAVIGCIMCICSTANMEWRVWHIDNLMGSQSPGIVGIGLWGACSVHPITAKKINVMCTEFAGDQPLPSEIIIAQDVMPLASIANVVTVFGMGFALYNIFKPEKNEDFVSTFFSIGAILDIIAGTFVLISVAWNTYSILAMEGIKLPKDLGLPLIPNRQYAGFSIHVGFIAAGAQLLSGTLVFSEKYIWRLRGTDASKDPLFSVTDPENVTERESPTLRWKYRQCDSTVEFECEQQPTTLPRHQRHVKMATMENSLGMWQKNCSSPGTGFF